MKIAQISLFALSSIDAQLAEISPAPFNYDDEFTSYDDDATLDGRKEPNRHPKARLRTLGKIKPQKQTLIIFQRLFHTNFWTRGLITFPPKIIGR